MTTNLAAIAGPSRHVDSQTKVEPASPLLAAAENGSSEDSLNGVSVTKPGLSVGENGEVVKVPAFLNKLFSMVSDHDTDELIYWADSGDSFFVPDHERFGQELLPRFFKHRNFSSFVRQLNMYGFHKVPHLQSGVLKNETPCELWEFVNPFFKRDQPQLLCRVTRKNNRPVAPTPAQGSTGVRSSARQAAANSQAYGVHLLTDGTVEGEAGPLVGPTGQLADLHAIQTGINAIRQTQAAIGADLKALQASNEHLWREALESRDRQQKHEETIDLIVSFLERLFGTEGEGLKGLKEAMRRGARGGMASTMHRRNTEDGSKAEEPSNKKRRRLMIADGARNDNEESARLVEIQEPTTVHEPNSTSSSPPRSSAEPWNSASHRFTSLPTDEDSGTPNKTPSSGAGQQTLHPGGVSPLSEGGNLGANGNSVGQYNGSVMEGSDPSGLNLDPSLLQTTIGSLLQSPAAAQMFLNTLNASSQAQNLGNGTQGKTSNGNYGQYGENNQQDPTLALFSPLPSQLVNNANNLMGTYSKAAGVGGDVEKLQESIDSLVRSMGLDLPQQNGSTTTVNTDASLPSEGTYNDSDFNVDDLLDQLAQSSGPNSAEHPDAEA